MILVDTSVWIDFLIGANSTERRVLHALIENEEEICTTGIILTEILQGIREENQYQTTGKYLLEFPVYVPKGIATYTEAASIFRSCRKKGKTVRSTVDCLIAAICMENDLFIFHKDRDYDIIRECAGLKVYKA
jgi:predicted nucleic acid-binding protein